MTTDQDTQSNPQSAETLGNFEWQPPNGLKPAFDHTDRQPKPW
jgi:hypothetical protein